MPRNLGDLLGERRYSEELAILFVDRVGKEERWSFRDIEQGTLAVTQLLTARKVPGRARVAIMAENSVPFLIAYFGIMRYGAVCVPVNTKQPPEILSFIREDASIDWAFVDRAGAELAPAGVDLISLDDVGRADESVIARATAEREPALILYTSGSTGRPKGVVLSHASQLVIIDSLIHSAEADAFADQRGLVVAPMFHMNALVFIQSFLAGGGSIALMAKFDAPRIIQMIAAHEVTVITGVPTMVTLLYRTWIEAGRPRLVSINTVYIGSAPVTKAVMDQSWEMMPQARVLNSYGTTETGGALFGPHPRGIPRPSTSVGYPMPHVKLHLERKQENAGVLKVKAPSMMIEYLNLPEQTQRKLRNGWFDTGDLFSRDEDGFYFFTGRADDMFVCSGESIYPGEVEKAIESHPEVAQAAVVPVADEVRGQMPVAFVVSNASGLSAEAVQEHVRRNAAVYLYPRRVWFLDSLPLSSTSKVDRKGLGKRAEHLMAEERAAQTATMKE